MMNIYQWRIRSMSGEVEALNVTDAICQAIQLFSDSMPYFDTPDTEFQRIDVIVKRIKE